MSRPLAVACILPDVRLPKNNLAIDGAKVAVQGFGNVGSEAANLFAQANASRWCIQDHTGTILNNNGIDLDALRIYMEEHPGVLGFPGATPITNDEFWDAEMDILIPAALEGQITVERAEN